MVKDEEKPKPPPAASGAAPEPPGVPTPEDPPARPPRARPKRPFQVVPGGEAGAAAAPRAREERVPEPDPLEDALGRIRKQIAEAFDRLGTETLRTGLEERVREVLDPYLRRLEGATRAASGAPPAGTAASHLLERVSHFLTEFLDLFGGPVLRRSLRRFSLSGVADEVDEFGGDALFQERVRPLFDFLFETWWRVRVLGVEHVPGKGGALLVGNHSGTLPFDAAMIKLAVSREHATHRDVRPLVEDFVYYFPFLSSFITRAGGVRASQENAERILAENEPVIVFPEGMKGLGKYYRDRYKLQRFARGGFIKLALRTRTPIVPVAVVGAEETYPIIARADWVGSLVGFPYFAFTPTFPWLGLLGVIPLPSKWTIEFGEPLDFTRRYGPEDAEDELLVNRLTEEVRSVIQNMLIDRLHERRSVWFG